MTDSKNDLLCGIAKVNITPSAPVRMSGYSGRISPFSEVHDSLYATAIVFNDGKTTAALITADIIGFSNTFCDEAADMIEKATGIPGKNILFSAVHSHGGPVTRVREDEAAGEEHKYIGILKNKLVEAVDKANRNLEPVQLGAGTGTCNMNVNRRAKYADNTIWLGINPEGPCDNDVNVVRIDNADKKPVAVLVNWACHATVGSSKNTQITGDWPGSSVRFAEHKLGDSIIVAVTVGASGDLKPLYGPNERFDQIDAIGMLIAEEVVRVTDKIKTVPGGAVKVSQKTVTAKGKKTFERSENKPPIVLEPDKDVEINLSVLKAGNIQFAGISGEVMTEIGMDIKAAFSAGNTIVITHCNGSSGYLCTDEAYPLGGYEVSVSRTMPGTEKLIKDNLFDLIRSLE